MEAETQIARYMAAHGSDELTAAKRALAERLAINVGLMMENEGLKRRLRKFEGGRDNG